MHPEIFQEFNRILTALKPSIGQRVLEIGAVPGAHSLLNLPAFSDCDELIGINLDGGESYNLGERKSVNKYRIIKANANDMSCFESGYFTTVVCNAMLEHDKYFWKTVSEINRVACSGALIVIGAPGFDDLDNVRLADTRDKFRRSVIKDNQLLFRGVPTIAIHSWPGDYYRYSPQAFREVVFAGMRDVEVYSVMVPPRIIGVGYRNGSSGASESSCSLGHPQEYVPGDSQVNRAIESDCLRQELDSVYASNSWRVTRPIRWLVSSFFRRG